MNWQTSSDGLDCYQQILASSLKTFTRLDLCVSFSGPAILFSLIYADSPEVNSSARRNTPANLLMFLLPRTTPLLPPQRPPFSQENVPPQVPDSYSQDARRRTDKNIGADHDIV